MDLFYKGNELFKRIFEGQIIQNLVRIFKNENIILSKATKNKFITYLF